MKILNMGSMNIDYIYKMTHFIQPGETQSCDTLTLGCGGKGLNQSIALARAGAEVYHAGFVGKEGAFLLEKLAEKGVRTEWIRFAACPSGHAIIQVVPSGQNCIILYGGANRQFTEAYIDEVLAAFAPGDIVVLQNEINCIPYIMERAFERGLQVAFNAAPYNDRIRDYPLDKVRWLIVNEVEGGGLSGETGYEAIADKLLAMYPHMNVLLTLGADGCMYRSRTERVDCRACKVTAVDTTAAGDTFIGYFLKGVAEGLPVAETLRLATVASGISVTRPGAADSIPSYAEAAASPLLKRL